MKKVIEVNNLFREYKIKKGKIKENKIAVNGISFHVYEGEIFGLLGPNGAGKSTTIKVLTTLLTPTSGEIKIMGLNLDKEYKKIRELINFVFGGEKGVYYRLTAKEYLKYFAYLYKLPEKDHGKKIDYLLNLVGLVEYADQEIQTYSKGTIQRLHIARALLNDPRIVFLDEPTIGLDPIIAEQLREIIRNLSREKITVILTTHYLKEADDLCDRIGIINKGELIVVETPLKIKETCSNQKFYESTCQIFDEPNLMKSQTIKGVKVKTIKEDVQFIRFEVNKEVLFQEIVTELEKYIKIHNLEQREVTLEDAYINLLKVENDDHSKVTLS